MLGVAMYTTIKTLWDLGKNKTEIARLTGYDWNTTTTYDRDLVKKLMNLAFLEKHASVLVFGPTGVGKTFLARHFAFSAITDKGILDTPKHKNCLNFYS